MTDDSFLFLKAGQDSANLPFTQIQPAGQHAGTQISILRKQFEQSALVVNLIYPDMDLIYPDIYRDICGDIISDRLFILTFHPQL